MSTYLFSRRPATRGILHLRRTCARLPISQATGWMTRSLSSAKTMAVKGVRSSLQYNVYIHSPITRNIVKNTSLTLVYQLTDDGRRSCNRSSAISSAGSENPPNASSPRSRVPHNSLATPIRETWLYVGKKFNAQSGQRTETRIKYCFTKDSVCLRICGTAHSRLLQ